MHHLTVDVDDGLVPRRRQDAAGAGVREPADQRRQVHAVRRLDRRQRQARGRRCCASRSRTPASACAARCCPSCSICSSRDARVWTDPKAASAWGSASSNRWSTLHDGTVEAHSNGPGKGSEFVVLLAGDDEGTGDGGCGHGHRRRARARGRNPRAGACCSSTTTRTRWRRSRRRCSDLGHAVEVAHDGPEALAKLETFSPDIALLDIGLPLMDGYELARRIRHERGWRGSGWCRSPATASRATSCARGKPASTTTWSSRSIWA